MSVRYTFEMFYFNVPTLNYPVNHIHPYVLICNVKSHTAICFFLAISFCAVGAIEDTTSYVKRLMKAKKSDYDSLFVKSFTQKLNTSFIVDAGRHGLEAGGFKHSYRLRVNRPVTLGIGIDYKWLGLELRIPAFWSQPEPQKGDSRGVGLRLNVTGRKHSISSFF